MNKTGVYTITNSVNGKVYIGSAIDFPRRWAVHISTGLRAAYLEGRRSKSPKAEEQIGPEGNEE